MESVNIKVGDFFRQYKYQVYKKGEILIRADEEPKGIFYLTSGTVKQYAISRNGEEVIVNIFKPSSFFPMSWAINKTPNVYFFEAIGEVEVKLAPANEVVELVRQDPEIIFDLLERVYRGVDGMQMRMAQLMGGSAYNRLATEIVIEAKRFGKKQNGLVEINISEKDLAALTGITRETVSRELKNLKVKGFVKFSRNKLTIINFPGLEQEQNN